MRTALLSTVALVASFLVPVGSSPIRGASTGDQPAAPQVNLKSKITPETRKSIDKGTQWLLSAMHRDGSVGPDLREPTDLGCTAIVGLALLSQGNSPQGGPHSIQLRKLLNAVLQIVQKLPKGNDPLRPETLVQKKIGRHADLFLTALFLSQVLGETTDRNIEGEIRTALERLVGIISNAQQKDGTWGENSWAPILGTVLGWECLRSSHSCGLKVEASATLAAKALLEKLKVVSADTGDWMHDFYKYASSVRVLYSLEHQEDPLFKNCVKRLLDTAKSDPRVFTQAGGEEFLAFYLVTECMQQGTDPAWKQWYPIVSTKLVGIQNADGSWTGHHCIRDRTFCTAAALLSLQAPDLHLPISDL